MQIANVQNGELIQVLNPSHVIAEAAALQAVRCGLGGEGGGGGGCERGGQEGVRVGGEGGGEGGGGGGDGGGGEDGGAHRGKEKDEDQGPLVVCHVHTVTGLIICGWANGLIRVIQSQVMHSFSTKKNLSLYKNLFLSIHSHLSLSNSRLRRTVQERIRNVLGTY